VPNSVLDFPPRDRANESSTDAIDYLGNEYVDSTILTFS